MKQKKKTNRSKPIISDRVRSIGNDGFAFIPNRFLHDGFYAALQHDELLLYFLLILISNRRGISYYHYDTLCEILRWPAERYLSVRNSLIVKDLIAFDGTQIQVLELPKHVPASKALQTSKDLDQHDEATIRALITKSLRGSPDDGNSHS